jgi:hypothetical protein
VQGPIDGWVFDSVFFEVDIKTNNNLFRWSVFEDGIPFIDSQALLTSQFELELKTAPAIGST